MYAIDKGFIDACAKYGITDERTVGGLMKSAAEKMKKAELDMNKLYQDIYKPKSSKVEIDPEYAKDVMNMLWNPVKPVDMDPRIAKAIGAFDNQKGLGLMDTPGGTSYLSTGINSQGINPSGIMEILKNPAVLASLVAALGLGGYGAYRAMSPNEEKEEEKRKIGV